MASSIPCDIDDTIKSTTSDDVIDRQSNFFVSTVWRGRYALQPAHCPAHENGDTVRMAQSTRVASLALSSLLTCLVKERERHVRGLAEGVAACSCTSHTGSLYCIAHSIYDMAIVQDELVVHASSVSTRLQLETIIVARRNLRPTTSLIASPHRHYARTAASPIKPSS